MADPNSHPADAGLFTPRELAHEMLRWFKRDIPETVVAALKIILRRYIETGVWLDDIGMMIGKQPSPPLAVQREAELLYREIEELLRKAQIDYPVSAGQQGGWIRLRDWSGNYLLTMRANTKETAFVTALVTRFPEILAILRSKPCTPLP